MIDPSWGKTDYNDPRGPVSYARKSAVPPDRGASSQNCVYRDGPATRFGFGEAYDVNQAVTAMTNWQSGLGNYVAHFTPGTGVRLWNVASPTPATVVSTASGVAFTAANAGARLYLAIFGSNQRGAVAGQVVGYAASAFYGDALFAPPITYTPSAPTEPGAGRITAGLHKLGYIIEFRSGYTGRPSPNASGAGEIQNFQPVDFTAAGSANATWTLNPTAWPTGAVKVHVIMTPVANPALYFFVPGANAAVPGGSAQSTAITFNISDDELYRAAVPASDHLLLMSQTTTGTAPFQPQHCFLYGDRMVYITTVLDNSGNATGAAYVSQRNTYQQIFADRSLIQLPGQLDIVTGAEIANQLCLFGPSYTFTSYDSAPEPSEWQTPKQRDGRRGSPAIRGVDVSVALGIAWVANPSGLLTFDGLQYSERPVSYWFTDQWERINWEQPHLVQVIDHAETQTVHVFAALDDSTTINGWLTICYRRGFGFNQVDWSPWTMGSFPVGGGAIVKNGLTGQVEQAANRPELWIFPRSADAVRRQKVEEDTDPYIDGTAEEIDFLYELGPAPKGTSGELLAHHGLTLEIEGSGDLQIYQVPKGGAASDEAQLPPITLESTPTRMVMSDADMLSEECTYRLETQGAGSHCRVISARAHHSQFSTTH